MFASKQEKCYNQEMKKELTIIEFASLGGKARSLSLSQERRIEIAKKANEAMNAKRKLSPTKSIDLQASKV